MQQPDINNMTEEQLKALAYDERQKLDTAQQNVQILNQKIIEKMRAKIQAKAEEKKK